VVRAIAASPIPTISAVGHETDTTLADFAADRRAPTPTAAAEMAVPVRADLSHHVRELGARVERLTRRYADRAQERYDALADRFPALESLFAGHQQRLDEIGGRLPRALERRIAVARGDLAHAAGALRPALLFNKLDRAADRLSAIRLSDTPIRLRMEQGGATLDRLWRIAEQLHPDKPLERGYARVTSRDDRTVMSAEDARATAALTLHFAGKTTVDVRVERVEKPAKAPYVGPVTQPRLL